MSVVAIRVVKASTVRMVGLLLVFALVACGPALADASETQRVSQALSSAATAPVSAQAGETIWGKVPYCSCLATAATANVSAALKEANLTVSLKELSPQDGWLYFAVNFDPAATTWDQVSTAITTGGAELLDGPP